VQVCKFADSIPLFRLKYQETGLISHSFIVSCQSFLSDLADSLQYSYVCLYKQREKNVKQFLFEFDP